MEAASPEPIDPLPQSDQPKPRKRGTNVPIPIVVGVICLGLGIAGGVVLAEFVNEKKAAASNDDGSGAEDGDGKSAKGGPGGKGGAGGAGGPGGGKGGKGGFGGGKGGKGGKGGPGGGGGGFGGFSKIQLTQLVGVLDTLTAKPPAFQLSADEKKQLAGELASLADKDELTNDEARAKLEAIIKILEPHKDALQNAGFLWPGPPPAPPDPNNNPLKSSERLKSLQSTLGK